jgi:flagellar hook protein FlgE
MGFGQGLSGLNAAAQNLDVIGNNIANSGTVGFKSSTVSFADVYAQSRVGMGVQVAAVNQRFTAGNLRSSGGELDIAIDGEAGLFRLQDVTGNVFYSRNGEFHADKSNHIVNAQGLRLTGYIGGANSTTLGPITIPSANIAPSPTRDIMTQANFDANATPISATDVVEVLGEVTLTDSTGAALGAMNYRVSSTGVISWVDASGNAVAPPADGTYTSGAGVTVEIAGGQIVSGYMDDSAPNVAYVAPVIGRPFSPTDPDSFSHSLPIQVYDSLGNSHQVTQYFVKRSGASGTTSQWDVHYTFDGRAVDAPANGGPLSMTFDSAGRLTSEPRTIVSVNQAGLPGAPAEPLAINLDYSGSTQFGGGFTPSFFQNGYATGEYSGLSIGTNGEVVASYTNGEKQTIGRLALADFANLQGLKPVGNNAWQETPDSGQPIVGYPGENGLSQIKGQSLEESNVDMSQELVNMIIAQRNYQANAQTIKTQDQLMQPLMQMR